MIMHIYFYWMPMAKQLYTVTKQAGIDVEFCRAARCFR